ncbi:carbohydrate porin [Paraburkholderia rhizosphaerae]|nr:carbohydrate porin [Paraburkholderia rhizosphaerae]
MVVHAIVIRYANAMRSARPPDAHARPQRKKVEQRKPHASPSRFARLRGIALPFAFYSIQAIAQTDDVHPANDTQTEPPTQASAQTATPPGLWNRATLFGDIGGLRPWLGQYGITFGLQETSEYLNNLSGGTARGGAYDGVTEFSLGVDTQKAFGLDGGIFNVSGLQIHGTSISTRNLQTLQFASGIEADATTRLWELWYQQAFAAGRVDIKVGEQSVDQEFMTSEYASTFINATFGWSALPSVDLPAGGPTYPLASPGVRVRAMPGHQVTVLAGVFGSNPAGNGTGDPQRRDAHGTNFSLRDGALIIGEIQYAFNPPPANASDAQNAGLPGTWKLGFWYDTQSFDDQGFASNGVSLASPDSSGIPQSHHGNWSVYAVADQMVWRDSNGGPRSVGVFARLMGGPGDRNLVDFGANAGVTLTAPFRGRDNDVAGIAVGYARIGSHARDLASTTAQTVPGFPSRTAETVIEATYQYQIAPWWQLQGDAQYFFRPSGGIPNPDNPAERIGNAFVIGVRTTLTF